MIRNIVVKTGIRIMFPQELKRYSFYIKPTVRLCLIAVFVRSTLSITVSWTSVISLFLLLVSYLFFKSRHQDDDINEEQVPMEVQGFYNPYKGKTGVGHLSKERQAEIALAIEGFIVDDAGKAECLERFEVIKANSECIFAKKAKVWGSPDYDKTVSLEENMRRVYPTLLKFTFAFMDLGLGAFLIELPGTLYGKDIETFADAVGQTLYTFRLQELRRIHKQKSRMMTNVEPDQTKLEQPIKKPLYENTKDWGKLSWVFEINKITFFITTFAPFYPETNSRYSHGSEDCYILFQPEISFAIHDLPPDSPKTNWTCPVTVRDKIRVAFNNAGRYYDPPMVHREPMVYDIVKRVDPEDEVVRWWDSKARNTALVD